MTAEPIDESSATDLNEVVQRSALNTAEASRLLGVGYSTMKKWRTEGTGPRYAKIGSTVLYRPEDLEAFLVAQLVDVQREVPRGRSRSRTGRRSRR